MSSGSALGVKPEEENVQEPEALWLDAVEDKTESLGTAENTEEAEMFREKRVPESESLAERKVQDGTHSLESADKNAQKRASLGSIDKNVEKPDSLESTMKNAQGDPKSLDPASSCTLSYVDVDTKSETVKAMVEHACLDQNNQNTVPVPEMNALKIDGKEKDTRAGCLQFNENEKETKIVLSKYLSMAVKGKASQAMLLQDSDICAFLTMCIIEDSPEIVLGAFEVFEVLLCNRSNYSALQQLPCFMDTLRRIAKSSKHTSEIRDDAQSMLKKLQDTRAPLGEHSNATRNAGNSNTNTRQPEKQSRKSETVTTTKTSKKPNGKETILYLDYAAIQKVHNRQRILDTLIKVTGIISVTYNPKRNFCIIRGKRHIPSEDFATAVAKLGYSVHLVYKNEQKEEVMIPVEVDKNDGSTLKENYPSYLPEEEEEVPVQDNAVCNTADSGKGKQKEDSWWGSAMKSVKESLYW